MPTGDTPLRLAVTTRRQILIDSAATRALDQLKFSYHVFEHGQPPTSLVQTADERGQIPA